MDFNFSSEQEDLRRTVRQFARRELAPIFEEADATGHFPPEIFPRLAELGFLCVTAPAEAGGPGASKVDECLMIEEFSRVSSSMAAVLMVHGGVATSALVRHGSPALRDRYLKPAIRGEAIAAFALTEPDAGSDAAAIRTRAVRDGSDYIINGRKTYITNGGIADFLLVAAVTDPQARRGQGISLFIVERGTPGFEVARPLKKVGHEAANTAELVFDNCVVPGANLVGEPGKGFAYLNETLTGGRISHSARSLGVAREAFDITRRYVSDRKAFGQHLISFQAIAFTLSEMATAIDAASLLVYRAAALYDQGIDCVKEASMAKLFASETAETVTGRGMHLHGGFGYMKESRIQQLWRDAKLFPITEGTSEIQKILISRNLAKESRSA
jgi:alkylation response protein AidB-like acyl-CoA dehydrogenase